MGFRNLQGKVRKRTLNSPISQVLKVSNNCFELFCFPDKETRLKMTRTSNGHAQKQLRHDFILGWSLIHDMPLSKFFESRGVKSIFSEIPCDEIEQRFPESI